MKRGRKRGRRGKEETDERFMTVCRSAEEEAQERVRSEQEGAGEGSSVHEIPGVR
jgi:hypothetical protein